MSLLGIDVGTSGCKTAIYSIEGQRLASAYEEYDVQRPQPGWAELDAPRVWDQIQQTIHLAVREANQRWRRDPIQALCISSLGEAVVPVSADRQILGPSLLNFDERGAEFLPRLRQVLADGRLFRINGNTLGNHYSLTKLLWLQRYQPRLFQRAKWFLHWSGLVSFMLGAEAAIDYSLANRTLLFDLEQKDWSEELPRLAQLELSKLPPVVPSGSLIGEVSTQAAEGLGLPQGIPIISGGHDQCCSGVGCGVIQPGQAMYGIGTYICMMPVFAQRPEPEAMMAQGLNIEHHAAPGQMVSFIYNQGGVLVKWFRDTYAAADRDRAADRGGDVFTDLMAEMPKGASRVMALPHFTATGPPHFISDSCGVIGGLYLDTPRGEILKGLVEGTTFYLRECFEGLPDGITIADFRACGGGSKSDAWLQTCADILGRPFHRTKVSEAGTLGAAILAGTGSGIFASLEQGVSEMVGLERSFLPETEMQAIYTERFEKYRRFYPLVGAYLRELNH